ncbi:helix-turn-helix domain-containing protein [Vagococcus entomophilus]|uniref:HTH cro/C1-type domain-containing protein n=1 Tax=Vagococcus entomophilus TaxID=1160095 RepID=A0A430AKZ1_9ENTE|nr:Rgg/GadR/MutR family transcriptional regulator [Vagococcus entomophilus]RSU08755.1 hypothetical protein CBF30_05900 [Vagococcus entomophilus]
MEVGKALKMIRTSKNLTQKSVAEGIMTRAHYANVEAGKIFPAIDKVLDILKKFNVSAPEFFFIVEGYKMSEEQNLFSEVSIAWNLNNIEKLKEIQQSLRMVSKAEQRNQHYRLILNLVDGLIYQREPNYNEEKLNEILQPIKDYLTSLDTWYVFDLHMFNNILYIFQKEDIRKLSQILLEMIKKYENYPNMYQLNLAILSNLGSLFLDAEEYEEASFYMKEAIKFSEKKMYLYERLINEINLIICNFYLKKHTQVETTQALDKKLWVLKELGYESLVNQIKIEINQKYSEICV